jgi:hypothetical protein
VNQLPKSVVREIRTPRSVGAGGGRPPPATRWASSDRRLYSTLPFDKLLSLGGRSEEISQICVVWGKAVAVSRLEPPTMRFGTNT